MSKIASNGVFLVRILALVGIVHFPMLTHFVQSPSPQNQVASSVTTLVLTTGRIVTLASYATATLAPYAAYQTHKLKALGSIRGEQNTLRQSTNELTEQNHILSESIDKLEVQVTA